ncbi:MAG: pantoate--beta-alanine ligase [Gemmatimonadota bacterium]|nr:MAG: pantoate--beta-alanine ligase [Gemmatimonadota bacterium]
MRLWSRSRRDEGLTVGLVPTMGYFHEGHLRLIEQAKAIADTVVVSLFVNPIQFGPQEDLAAYPRDLARDRAAALARGADCLFVPTEGDMYPAPQVVRVVPGSLADHLCGARRPGHFEGVLTVVLKLLNIVEPQVAVFGRKDVQQAVLIRRMVGDLNVATEIVIAPTVREADGLAMSSRNAYLTPEERRVAPALARGLEAAHAAFAAGVRDVGALLAAARAPIEEVGALALEYLEIVDPVSLAPSDAPGEESIVAVAARLGAARLIDNVTLGEGTSGDVRVGA